MPMPVRQKRARNLSNETSVMFSNRRRTSDNFIWKNIDSNKTDIKSNNTLAKKNETFRKNHLKPGRVGVSHAIFTNNTSGANALTNATPGHYRVTVTAGGTQAATPTSYPVLDVICLNATPAADNFFVLIVDPGEGWATNDTFIIDGASVGGTAGDQVTCTVQAVTA